MFSLKCFAFHRETLYLLTKNKFWERTQTLWRLYFNDENSIVQFYLLIYFALCIWHKNVCIMLAFSWDLMLKYELKCVAVFIKFTSCFVYCNCMQRSCGVWQHVQESRCDGDVCSERSASGPTGIFSSDGLPTVIKDARESHMNPCGPTHLQITHTRNSPTGKTKIWQPPAQPRDFKSGIQGVGFVSRVLYNAWKILTQWAMKLSCTA